jgi:16S rRNA (cytosine1402-N4)-methyltransferase
MRLDPDADLSAYEIVNKYPEREIADILFGFGEERYAKRIARRIIRERHSEPIRGSLQLAEIIRRAVPTERKKPGTRPRRHPATRSFQALRIAVNRELQNLEEVLDLAFDVLVSGGRMGVITFHSLEDRIVKRFFAEKNKACRCPPEWPICQCEGRRELRILTKKPIRPKAAEKETNPSSRSANLRVVEKL